MHTCPVCKKACDCAEGEADCTHFLGDECGGGDDPESQAQGHVRAPAEGGPGAKQGGTRRAMTPRRYFTEEDARNLIGRRVQARVALSRRWLRDLGLWIGSGSLGTVTQFAFGPEPGAFVIGVHWDPVPRRRGCPIDWYTEDDYRALLGVPVEQPALECFDRGAA